MVVLEKLLGFQGLLTFKSELGEPDIAKTSDSLKVSTAASFLHTAVGAEKLKRA